MIISMFSKTHYFVKNYYLDISHLVSASYLFQFFIPVLSCAILLFYFLFCLENLNFAVGICSVIMKSQYEISYSRSTEPQEILLQ